MPPTFQLPLVSLGISRGDTEVWIPLGPSPSDANRGSGNNIAYARRKPGVSLEQAKADAKRVATAIAAIDPARYRNYTAGVADLRESTIGLAGSIVRAPLMILLGGAGLLLLIACANVATLLLARSVVRARETAIRVALGASRSQLALRYFAEGALVSVAGAAAGVGLSVILVRQILAAASGFISRVDDIAIDWTVLGFSVAVAVATGVLAGMAPLWQAMRTAPNAVLSEGVRASAARPAQRLSKAFVVVEIALAFTLLTTSAILLVHMRNLERVSLGFDPDGLVAFNLTLPRGAGTPDGTCRATACGAGAIDGRAAADARRDGCRVREPAASRSLLRRAPHLRRGPAARCSRTARRAPSGSHRTSFRRCGSRFAPAGC